MSQHSTEQLVITGSGYFYKGSGVVAVAGGMSQKAAENAADAMSFADMGVAFGMVGVALGLLVNAVAVWRRDKREKELHAMRVETLAKHGSLPRSYHESE